MDANKTDFFLMLLSLEVNEFFNTTECKLVDIRELSTHDEQFYISKKNKPKDIKLTPTSKFFCDSNKQILGIKLQDQSEHNEMIITLINNFDIQKEGQFEVGFMSLKNNLCLPKSMLGKAKVIIQDSKIVIDFHFNHQEESWKNPICFEGNLNLVDYHTDENLVA
jgi:hypothetical protein